MRRLWRRFQAWRWLKRRQREEDRLFTGPRFDEVLDAYLERGGEWLTGPEGVQVGERFGPTDRMPVLRDGRHLGTR